jgi:DNA modification methylase
MEYPKDFINKVVQGDCMEVMKQIPDNSVDLVVTDPPYEIIAGGGGGAFGVEKRSYHIGVKSLSYGFENAVLDECKRVLKLFNLYIFCSKDQILQILQWAKDNEFNIDVLCYHKLNPIPTVNNKYLSDTEYIIFIREKGAFLGGTYKTKKKYFLQNNAKSEFEHPTVKPLNIIQTLIENSSRKDEIILDPFLGSGTTARAALDLQRNFIGIEISPEYCKVAEKRLSQNVLNF